jgi:competence protein ComEC
MSDITNQNTEPLFIFDMPDDETLSETISVKGEKGAKGDPTKLSQLDNDTGFITANTDALANYYDKTATDTKLGGKLDKSTFNAYEIPSDFFTGAETLSGSGSAIALSNTADAYFKSILIYGDTSQDGTPAPLDPVDIETVTGEQTIAITGADTQTYVINLDGLELCKLGTLRDYIHYDGGKWYKHAAIGKVTLNGSESWTKSNSTANNLYIYFLPRLALNSTLLADKLAVYTSNQLYNNNTVGICYNTAGSGDPTIRIGVGLSGASTVSAFKSWLSENQVTLYYQLATAADEEITDDKLLRQLNALLKAKTYNGTTTISVTGSLPATLSVEAYADNWGGETENIHAALDNTYTKSEVDEITTDKVRFIFPKFWAGSRSGDCNLIKYKDKNILIDSHVEAMWSNVKAMLDDNDAKHIDYFILTHYHTDHQGNIKNLVNNGYIDADTVIYMSAEVSNYGAWYSGNIAEYTGFLTDNNLSYSVPDEGEELIIDGKLKLTFMNCDKDILDAYTSTSDGNACSTVVLIEFGNTKALYTGDADRQVCERLYGLGFPNGRVNLYKICHHGINQRTFKPFVYLVNPTFAVQTGGITDAVKNNFGICEETAILENLGAKIYPVHMQTDYIEFVSDGSAVNTVKGKTDILSEQWEQPTYYVDIATSTDSYQDGSETHPFKDLMQAISAIHAGKGVAATINLADGVYCVSKTDGELEKNRCYINTGRDVIVTIKGNANDRTAVVINGVFANRCNVSLKDLTLDLDQHNGLFVQGGTAILSNILITSLTSQFSAKSGIVAYENSRVVASNVRIEYANEAIIAKESTVVAADAIEIGAYQSSAISEWTGGIVITNDNITFDNSADKNAFTGWRIEPKAPVQIMLPHEFKATTINLAKTLAGFDWVEVFYSNGGSLRASAKFYEPNGKTGSIQLMNRYNDGVIHNRQARLAFSGSTITIERIVEFNVQSDGSQTVTLDGANDTGIEILKVIAGYKDYIDIVN